MAAQEIGSLYVGLGFDTAVFDRQIVQIPQQAQKAADGIKRGFQAAGQQLDSFTKSSGATRAAVQNLSFQLNDIGTSLASGGSPFRVLAQQGGQVLQAFQQGGGFRQVMGGVAVSLRGLITPAAGAVAGVLAVAGGIAVLTVRAVENQSAMRQFSVMLKGLGLEGQATAAGLEEAAKQLRDVGLSASEARAAITAATRAGIAPGQAARVVRIGQNLIPALGADAPAQLISAIAGGVEPLGKLVMQLGLVTAREVEAAREAANFGQQLSFLDRWVGLIEQKSKGLNEQALSPMGKAMRQLSIAFNELLDSMSRSNLIIGIVDAMTKLAGVLKNVFELQPPNWFKSLFGTGGRMSGDVAYADIPPAAGGAAGGGGATGGAGAGRSGVLSYGQIKQLAINAGFQGPAVDTITAIALAESDGRINAHYVAARDDSYGITQINALAHGPVAKEALDPQRAMELAYSISKGGSDFRPWSTWLSRKYMSRLQTGTGPEAMAGGTAGGSVLARPNQPQDEFLARREAEFRDTTRGTARDTAYENYLAQATRAGRVAMGGAEAQAGVERSQRYLGAQKDSPQALAELDARTKQLLTLAQARGRLSLAQGGEADRQTTEQLQLQASLFGQSTTEIEKQISLLKIRQQAEAAGLPLTDQAVKAREEEAKHLAETNDLLRQQQSLLSQMREIAGVFENAFSSAFDAIGNGTFKLRSFLGGLLKDLGKTLASSAFKRLLSGEDGGGGGILGSLVGKVFGIGSGLGGGSGGDFGSDLPAFATGGSFQVGGSGGIDSQLVQFRASPGERVDVSTPGRQRGGYGEVIRIDLNPSEGWVSGVADQRIVTHSGTIVDLAVRQSAKSTQRNFAGYSAEAQARQM